MPEAKIGGRRLSYEDSGGEGTPILLLHGFPHGAALWESQFAGLGGRFRIIAPDLPGFGGSEPPPDPMSWRIQHYADAAFGLLDELGVEKAVVGGISMGGYVAFSMLRRRPERIQALVLVDTAPGADSEETRDVRTEQQKEAREKGIEELSERLLLRLLSAKHLADPELRKRVKGLMAHPPPSYVAALEAMKHRPDSTPELGRIKLPCLIVVGEEDVITPPRVAQAMQRAIPGSRLVVLPGAGHLSNVEDPEGFNQALSDFVAGL